MIEEIIKLREDGLSFRKIASELNTTVGRVQYRWNKWVNNNETEGISHPPEEDNENITSENQPSTNLVPIKEELQAKLVSLRKIILFWEISEIPVKLIRLYFNRQFEELTQLVRIYDVTDIIFNGKNANHFYEIAVPYNHGYWFVKGLTANRSYIAELGVKFNENDFFPVYRSNSIQTPSMGLPNGSEMYYDLAQYQQLDNSPPKWIDYVSTYSYYGESTANNSLKVQK